MCACGTRANRNTLSRSLPIQSMGSQEDDSGNKPSSYSWNKWPSWLKWEKCSSWPVASVRRAAGRTRPVSPGQEGIPVCVGFFSPVCFQKTILSAKEKKKSNFKVCCGFIYPQINVVTALNLPFCFKLLEHWRVFVSLFSQLKSFFKTFWTEILRF